MENATVVNLNLDSQLEELFNEKCEKMRNFDKKLDNETQLKLYGLYKVATVGKIREEDRKNFGFFDLSAKYKV